MKPERMVIQCTDGSEFPFTVEVNDYGTVRITVEHVGRIELRAESVWSVAVALERLITDAETRAKAVK
jgi:hypothetical protein